MTTLVIGGDHIDSIRRELAEHGREEIEHWGGRKPADTRRAIPARVDLMILVTDYLSHNMLYSATCAPRVWTCPSSTADARRSNCVTSWLDCSPEGQTKRRDCSMQPRLFHLSDG